MRFGAFPSKRPRSPHETAAIDALEEMLSKVAKGEAEAVGPRCAPCCEGIAGVEPEAAFKHQIF